MQDERPIIEVDVAVIRKEGRYLVSRRRADTHLGGLWDFPGGKRHPGEAGRACAQREALEEVGLRVEVFGGLLEFEHPYPDRTVHLHFHACACVGPTVEAQALSADEVRWVTLGELRTLPLPEANRFVVGLLGTMPNLLEAAWRCRP